MKDFNLLNYFKNNNKELPLKKGLIVNVQHNSMNMPITSVIKKVDGRKIFIHVNEEIEACSINLGDELVCKVLANRFEYVLNCQVIKKEMQNMKYLEININKFQKYKNKRLSKRYNTHYLSTVTTTITFSEIKAHVKNISLTGMYIVVYNQKLLTGNEGIISIYVDVPSDDLLYCKVKIVRICNEEGYDSYYTKITEIDAHNKKVLVELINKLRDEENSIIFASTSDFYPD